MCLKLPSLNSYSRWLKALFCKTSEVMISAYNHYVYLCIPSTSAPQVMYLGGTKKTIAVSYVWLQCTGQRVSTFALLISSIRNLDHSVIARYVKFARVINDVRRIMCCVIGVLAVFLIFVIRWVVRWLAEVPVRRMCIVIILVLRPVTVWPKRATFAVRPSSVFV